MSWSRIAWDETLPANTDVQFQLALSNSQNGPWTYLGPDGTAGTYFTTASGETLPATPAFTGRYARFQTRLSSTDGQHTPSFGNVHLSFTGAGLLASSCNNFAYDPAGNITSVETVTDAGTTMDDRNPVANPINALNQVLQRDVGGVSWLFSYDLNGNLTGKTNGTDTFLNTWNDLNQLTRVQGPGGLDVRYTYDTSGRMLTRTSGGVTRRFTWDAWDCVKEETGSSVTIYHIPDGTLHSFSLDGAVFQIHSDALGSVRMITDASGTVVARLEYGAWGEEIFVSAIPALQNFPYRFVGALGVRTDSETGLVWMRQRWFDPTTQRFISRDPIGLSGGANLYSYVANNPTNYSDVNGLSIDPAYMTPNQLGLYCKKLAQKMDSLIDKIGYKLRGLIEDPLNQGGFTYAEPGPLSGDRPAQRRLPHLRDFNDLLKNLKETAKSFNRWCNPDPDDFETCPRHRDRQKEIIKNYLDHLIIPPAKSHWTSSNIEDVVSVSTGLMLIILLLAPTPPPVKEKLIELIGKAA